MTVTKVKSNDRRLYKVKIAEKDTLGLDLNLEFDYDEVPSAFYSVPLSKDKTNYFAAVKKAGL